MSGSLRPSAGTPFVEPSNKQTLSFVSNDVMAWQEGALTLIGSRCVACGELFFPRARGCTRCCGTGLTDTALGHQGRLWSWTVQGFRPKQPYDGDGSDADFQPYGVGYVELDNGLKVEARLTVADPAQLRIGMPMRLTLDAYRRTPAGEPVHTYAFEPAPEAPAP